MSLTKSQQKQKEKQMKWWRERESEQLKHYINDEKEYQKHINEIYDYMMDQIQKEINGFYSKYASKEGITLAEAKRRVSKLDIDAYERKAKRYVKDKNFPKGAKIEIVSKGTSWHKVKYNGKTGYCSAKYIKLL